MQAFFTRWWHEQDKRMRRVVRRLVRDKQLGFVNGGYVQNDEAASHFVAMIDQTTRGHRSGPAVAAHVLRQQEVYTDGRQPVLCLFEPVCSPRWKHDMWYDTQACALAS
jgi:Glycosyl hydrolases family 38 N-terminal domain